MSQPYNRTTPFHHILRRRRQELRLNQAHVAEALNITPEAVGLWEAGRRRMELDKLPRIAEILMLQKRDFCIAALYQFHPRLYAELFGTQAPSLPRSTDELEMHA